MSKLNKDDWVLNNVEVKFNYYGDDEGKYTGTIRFTNGFHESFSFRVRPDMAHDYIKLIAGDIVLAAENLGDRLIKSIGKTIGNDKIKEAGK